MNTASIEAALLKPSSVPLENGAKSAVLRSHLGRPMGEKIVKFSITLVAKAVEEKIGKPLQQVNEVIGSEVKAACADPAQGTDTLLENSRIYIEEEGRGKDTDQVTIKNKRALYPCGLQHPTGQAGP